MQLARGGSDVRLGGILELDLLEEDPAQVITVEGPDGPVTDTVEEIAGIEEPGPVGNLDLLAVDGDPAVAVELLELSREPVLLQPATPEDEGVAQADDPLRPVLGDQGREPFEGRPGVVGR